MHVHFRTNYETVIKLNVTAT